MVDFDRDGGNEGYSMLWKYRTGWSVDSVSITPNGKYVVAGSWDNHVYLLNKRGEVLWKYKTGSSVDSVSITPNGKYVVAGSWDNHVYLFASPQAISILEMKNQIKQYKKMKSKNMKTKSNKTPPSHPSLYSSR